MGIRRCFPTCSGQHGLSYTAQYGHSSCNSAKSSSVKGSITSDKALGHWTIWAVHSSPPQSQNKYYQIRVIAPQNLQSIIEKYSQGQESKGEYNRASQIPTFHWKPVCGISQHTLWINSSFHRCCCKKNSVGSATKQLRKKQNGIYSFLNCKRKKSIWWKVLDSNENSEGTLHRNPHDTELCIIYHDKSVL